MKFHQKSHRITLAKLGLLQRNCAYSRKTIDKCLRKGWMWDCEDPIYRKDWVFRRFNSKHVHWKRWGGIINFTESKYIRTQK